MHGLQKKIGTELSGERKLVYRLLHWQMNAPSKKRKAETRYNALNKVFLKGHGMNGRCCLCFSLYNVAAHFGGNYNEGRYSESQLLQHKDSGLCRRNRNGCYVLLKQSCINELFKHGYCAQREIHANGPKGWGVFNEPAVLFSLAGTTIWNTANNKMALNIANPVRHILHNNKPLWQNQG